MESIGRAFRIEPKLEKQELYQVALASALGKLGRIDDALSAYQRAANLNPKDLDAQAGLGWALFESGRSKDAEQSLKTAIRLDPNDAYSYEILGKVLRQLGRNEESISIWQRLTELRPKDSWAHASLGWALAGVGRLREAILALKKTSEIDPEFPAYDSIALYHAHLKEYQEAIDAGEKAILQQPDADTYCVLAAALLGQGKHELAIGACRQALELNPQFPEAWHNLGQAYFETSQFEKAVASFEKSIQFGPGIPDTHLWLGLSCLKLGRESAALEQCQFLHSLDINKEQELRDAISALTP